MNDDEPIKSGKAGSARKKPNIDAAFLRELASLLDETGLTEIEVEQAGTRIRVARQNTYVAAPPQAAPAIVATAPVAAVMPSAGGAAPAEPQREARRGTTVSSPMVGTAYMGPSPGAPPFVKVGDTVKEGQTLIIIEAMKTMNQVAAQVSGRITEIFVQDGQPVEFGEALMQIE